jgi:hypothetical protein
MLWLMLALPGRRQTQMALLAGFITAMAYADKATSFIFSAEALIFLALLFIGDVLRKEWRDEKAKLLSGWHCDHAGVDRAHNGLLHARKTSTAEVAADPHPTSRC